jgi:hypothetical protein
MRNVTITLEESVADWSRVWAASHQTSVSRMLGDLLAQKMAEEEGYNAAMEGYLATPASPLGATTSTLERPYPSRESSHER